MGSETRLQGPSFEMDALLQLEALLAREEVD